MAGIQDVFHNFTIHSGEQFTVELEHYHHHHSFAFFQLIYLHGNWLNISLIFKPEEERSKALAGKSRRLTIQLLPSQQLNIPFNDDPQAYCVKHLLFLHLNACLWMVVTKSVFFCVCMFVNVLLIASFALRIR